MRACPTPKDWSPSATTCSRAALSCCAPTSTSAPAGGARPPRRCAPRSSGRWPAMQRRPRHDAHHDTEPRRPGRLLRGAHRNAPGPVHRRQPCAERAAGADPRQPHRIARCAARSPPGRTRQPARPLKTAPPRKDSMKLHHLSRRSLVVLAIAGAMAPHALSQDAKPIEWVIGYAAGGGSDIVARTVAEQMSKTLQRPIIVNNKPGAATNIAADYVAKSKDFGNVMLTADFATLAANPSLFAKLPYDAEKDFSPVGLLARFPLLLVVANNVPAKNYAEFVAWAKTQRDGVNYASAGAGSPHHLAGELLREQSGLKLVHVPYRGAAPAVQDLLGGQVSAGIMDTASVQQYVQSGKLKAIGVASPARLKTLPDVPTLDEQGLKGFEAY